MKNTQHTGGNWYVERIYKMMDKTPHDHDIWAVYSTQKARYTDKPQHICGFDWLTPAGRANAHLIAAAPDLLEALEFLLADYNAIGGDKLTGSRVPAEKAIAAIQKATA